jgi:hypothetical protein
MALAFACVIAFLARRLFLTTDRTIVGDGQTGIRYWEIARASFQRGDGFPLWDRTECAGMPFLGNPETPIASSLFAALFDVSGDRMERWYATLGVVVAITGIYAWCRRALSMHAIPSLFAGAIFGASGYLCGHFAGHMTFVPFALLPWALLLARLGEDDPRAAVGVGALLALATFEGGTYPVPYMILALVVLEGPRALAAGRAYKVLRLASIAIVAFALLAGPKLYPELVQLVRNPRHFLETDRQTWTDLIPMFVENRHGAFPGHAYVLDEYRAYIGPLAFGFAIAGAGAAVILKPRRWEALVLIVVGLLLTRGHYSETAPYALLTKLPIFEQLRVPSRFVVLALLGMAVAGGVALDAAVYVVASKRPALQAMLVAIAAIGVYDPLVACQNCHKLWLTEPMLARTDVATTPYHLLDGREPIRNVEYPARNVGTAACFFKPWSYPEGRDFGIGDVPQARLDPGVGRVGKLYVGQNGYVIEVDASRPAVLHVNTTFDPDWSADVGHPQRSPSGQLDVQLPAGKNLVRLRYRPAGLVPGLAAMVLGLVFAGAVAWASRKRPPKRATMATPISPPGVDVATA